MKTYLVVYSTLNNRDWQCAGWRTAAEVGDLQTAKNIFDNFAADAASTEYNYTARGIITQVAIFAAAGRDTFSRRPRYYCDYRDKSNWPIRPEVGANINAKDADWF